MRLTMTIECREAVELVSDYLDGALPRRQRRRLERHLANCDLCSAYLAQMRVSIELSGSVAPEDLDAEVLEGLVALYRRYRAVDDDEH